MIIWMLTLLVAVMKVAAWAGAITLAAVICWRIGDPADRL
jgi:hypothetical protein